MVGPSPVDSGIGPDAAETDAGDGLDSAPRWGWGRWLLSIAASLILLFVVVAPVAVWWMSETASGRSFVASQIGNLQLKSGLRFQVGRLNGSLLSGFEVVDLRVRDLQGELAVVPLVEVDWHPTALLRQKLDIERLRVPDVLLRKRPSMNPSDPDAPLLPDFDIRIGRFDLGQLRLEEPVLGRAEVITAQGAVDIQSGRLLLNADVRSDSGDLLQLLVDAEPDGDRFALDGDLQAPAGGVVMAMLGKDRPLALVVKGQGSWTRWRGNLDARLGEGADALQLAALAITGDDGRFRVQGEVRPKPFLPENMHSLVDPAVKVDVTADRHDQGLDLRFLTSSDLLSLTGHGSLDSAAERLRDARADLVVRDSAVLWPGLHSRDLQAVVQAEGPLKALDIGWGIAARSLAYGEGDDSLGVTGLKGEGKIHLGSGKEPLWTSFDIAADSLLGLPADIAELLKAARLTGRAELLDGRTTLQDMALRTSALSADANLVIAQDGGMQGDAQAAVKRYHAEGFGAATAQAKVRFTMAAGGTTTADGQFSGRALSLENASLREFLGGLPSLSTRFRFRTDGAMAVSGLNLKSPNLNVPNASASFDPTSRRLAANVAGQSRDYGAFTLTAGGTLDAPHALLRAPSPGLGIGMTDLVAELSPQGREWLLNANAASAQGPLLARVRIAGLSGEAPRPPLTIDIEQAELMGFAAQGRLTRTAAGPFAGRVTLDGLGFDGALALSDQAGVQQILTTLSARNARIPLAVPVGVAGGDMRLRVLLREAGPDIRGNLAFRGVTRDTLVLSTLSGRADLQGLSGTASLSTEGHSGDGLPFTAQAGLRSITDGLALSLQGTVGRQALRLERPARLLRTDSGWELKPARLILPKGVVRVAGRMGASNQVQLAFDDVDLQILDLLGSDMGFGGQLNGQLSYATDAKMKFPATRLNLKISDMQRASITGLTVPVDITATGESNDDGLRLGAQIAWKTHQLGRLVVKVLPGAGATPVEHLMQGALSGGIRYNGPIEPLWALVGNEGQSLTGPMVVGADFAGTVAMPDLRGRTQARGLVYRNAMFGTEIRNIAFEGRFTGSMLRLESLSGDANGGTLTGSGFARFGAEPSVNFGIELKRARLANSDNIGVTLSGPLRLRGRGVRGTLSGDLTVDDARFQLVQMTQSDVPQLKVRREGVFVNNLGGGQLSASSLALDVRVRANDSVRVEGRGLDSSWSADLRLRGTADTPLLQGDATLVRGDFSFAGSAFNLTSGRIVFNGEPLNSSIALRAETRADDVVAVVSVSGTAARPEIHFSSTPALPEDEILARLLFGASVADLSVTEAVQLATAVAGLQSGTDTLGKVRRSVGVDRLRLVGDNSETGMGSGLAVGKKLTKDIYVELLTDSEGKTLTTLQLTLSRIWSLFMDVSSIGESSVNLRYQRER